MLAEAQARLEQHFASLHRDRKDAGFPVYALEHCLDLETIPALRSALSAELASRRGLQQDSWLVWVVVAAEVGYAFDGDEYWTSFARAVPNWRAYGDRDTIRSWFTKFAKSYAGLHPRGRWSDHFSIIAWPIAHAILPRDLQGQFARHLYELRFDLAREAAASVQQIGDLLRSRGRSGSSRFDNLLEQTELTARLVLALRDEDVQGGVTAIHGLTLARIVGDLERRQTSRDWLGEARRILRDGRIQGSGNLVGTTRRPGDGDPAVRRSRGLALVARQSSEGVWHLGICFPNLNQIIERAGVQSKDLNQARISLADQAGIWVPARALTAMSQRERPIASISSILEGPLIRFQPDIPALATLLSQELEFGGAAPWLLRIQSDGLARQVLGNHVRADERYLLIASTPVASAAASALNLQRCTSSIRDAIVYDLTVPSRLSSQQLAVLSQLKIGYALRTIVEPVGLTPRWDGSADGTVWLPSEELILSLRADSPIEEFIIGIDGGGWTHIAGSSKTIISLGHLPIGRHVVEVRATSATALSSRQKFDLEPEHLNIEVRAPVPWIDGIRAQAGFRALLTPPNASLRDVLEARAQISIVGPAGRMAAVEVETFDVNGHLAQRSELGQVAIPAEDSALHRVIAKLHREPFAELIQSAPRIDICVVVDELGRSAFPFFQRVQPLRWKLEKDQDGYIGRLVDEAGAGTEVTVERYDIRTPDKRIVLSREESLAGIPVETPGALLTAKLAQWYYPAVISVPGTFASLADLRVDVTLSASADWLRRIPRFTALHRLWARARTLGPLGALRRGMVLKAFEQKIASALCGEVWADRARQVSSGQGAALDRVQREVGGSPGFAHRMRTTDWTREVDGASPEGAFATWASRYGVNDEPALSELAFRLAFDPEAVTFNDPDKGTGILDRLSKKPALARGAFLARLVTDLKAAELNTGEAV